MRTLTDRQRWTIIDALYTAAAQYSEDAIRCADKADAGVAAQFSAQCRAARELAMLIEQANEIALKP